MRDQGQTYFSPNLVKIGHVMAKLQTQTCFYKNLLILKKQWLGKYNRCSQVVHASPRRKHGCIFVHIKSFVFCRTCECKYGCIFVHIKSFVFCRTCECKYGCIFVHIKSFVFCRMRACNHYRHSTCPHSRYLKASFIQDWHMSNLLLSLAITVIIV